MWTDCRQKGASGFPSGFCFPCGQVPEYLETPSDNVVAFRINGKPEGDTWLNTTVVLNADTAPAEIAVPEGKYWIVCRDGKIDPVMGLGVLNGNKLVVAPRTAMIVHQ